jgi:AmmeMemoRadiSam system protein A
LSYEAPWGVGYLVAQLVNVAKPAPSGRGFGEGLTTASSPQIPLEPAKRAADNSDIARHDQPASIAAGSDYISALARRAIESFIRDDTIITPPEDLPDELTAQAGCFVSIKTLDGDLRGCIGTVDPVKDTLAEEIITNGINSATRDPRFAPVRPDELPNLKYSVDVLSAPEPCKLDELDPKIYGVVVEDETGFRRGLLLPNLEGISLASHQVEVASQKAGIPRGTPVKLYRFRSDRHSE